MEDKGEYELVIKAIACGTTGCLEWNPQEAMNVRKNPWLKGLTPEGIREDLIDHVRNGGIVKQVRETRRSYSHRNFYYKSIVPYPDLFQKGLFVEMELFIPDPDCPVVHILNAHEQK
jgi:hypothetical protein